MLRRVRRPVLIALGALLGAAIILQIVNANALSNLSDAYKDGRVNVPGSKVLQLPAGKVEVILEAVGVNTFRIPPRLHVTVTPSEGASLPLVRDVGGQFGMGDRFSSLEFKRVWRADVPRAGAYRVVASGTAADTPYKIDFGHGPPLSAVTIWLGMLVAMGVVVLGALGFAATQAARGP